VKYHDRIRPDPGKDLRLYFHTPIPVARHDISLVFEEIPLPLIEKFSFARLSSFPAKKIIHKIA
jgi:hypothetical protein